MNASGRASRRPGVRSTRGRPVRGGVPRPPRRWLLPVAMTVITAVVLALYFTPILGVRSVRVEGVAAIPEGTVLDTAGIELGNPMLQVDSEAVRSRLGEVPEIAGSEVHLEWPSTVRLEITERTAVAYLPADGPGDSGVRLIDATGVPFRTVPRPPAGLAQLRLGSDRAEGVRAAMIALTALPPQLRAEVTEVRADRPQNLYLGLTGGRQVHWGESGDAARKSAILIPLLTREGKVYDVTSPDLPTVA
ncbi:cell division protein FtsQ/DivIB [Saccharopolyspora gloriosae]|uniref:cell division protein FtsQ/DivIB n=1 Tax=Saccharopolyspora gloriosae TaxID=455344 RepID=UPI001FB72D94|nr:FtsQ-type POTRA domain-containing protein [Saccharopolyspora gloriosae]